MPWVRIDEHALNHVKILALSHGAFRLWVEGLAHCQKHLTDGAISRAALRGFRYASRPRVDELVASVDSHAPLWTPDEDGWRVHDYLQWNESREHVLEARKCAKDRMANLRSGRRSREQPTEQPLEQTGERSRNVRDTTTTTTCSKEQNTWKRAKGHEHHVYCGVNFHVSARQRELLLEGLGTKRADWTDEREADCFRRWDGENSPIYNLLPWLRDRIRTELGIKPEERPGNKPFDRRVEQGARRVPSVDATKAYMQRIKQETADG